MIVTRVESFCEKRDSSRVRITKNRDSTHAITVDGPSYAICWQYLALAYFSEVFGLCFFWLRMWSCLVNFESASSPTPPLPWCKQSDSCLTPHQQKSCIFHIISTKWAPFYLLHCKHSSHNLLYAWLELMPVSILPPRFWWQQAWQKWSKHKR